VVTPEGLEHRHTNIDMQITNGKMYAPTLILASLEYLENIEIFVMFIDALTKKKKKKIINLFDEFFLLWPYFQDPQSLNHTGKIFST
jgi:hypothetical protein